jgi:hypothetical protein
MVKKITWIKLLAFASLFLILAFAVGAFCDHQYFNLDAIFLRFFLYSKIK